jgi:sugar O-acyltransferase (sialic acid O-acetyltransferase NeuD family)
VIEQEGKFQIAGIIDVPEKLHQKILGYDVIATDSDLADIIREYDQFLITIGQIKNATNRKKLFERLKALNAKFPIIISPLAYVSRHAVISEGTIVMHKAVINAGAKVGRNCIINTKALVEHDAQIGDHCHIATASVINGGVKVGSETFFGSNAVSREYVEIGKKSVIGCNAKVIKNVPSDTILK